MIHDDTVSYGSRLGEIFPPLGRCTVALARPAVAQQSRTANQFTVTTTTSTTIVTTIVTTYWLRRGGLPGLEQGRL